MKMDEVIARINALAKKAKAEGLTPEELAERDKLRRIYIDSVKANLVGQLENTYIIGTDGVKRKVGEEILNGVAKAMPFSNSGADCVIPGQFFHFPFSQKSAIL